jgi:uncharacterized damage-inducible protein DinB
MLLSALQEVLDQGLILLGSIDESAYIAKVPNASNASVGAHYRHCLDHFSSLLNGLSEGMVDYDARKRDPLLETDRKTAAEMTRLLQTMASKLEESRLSDPIKIRCKISYTSDEIPMLHSRVDREVMFCISHAIHHYALIAMILRSQGHVLPPHFGVAPSTVRHRNSCAPSR